MLKSELTVDQFKQAMGLCGLDASHDHQVWDTLDSMNSNFKAHCISFAGMSVDANSSDEELAHELDKLQIIIDTFKGVDDRLADSWAQLNDFGDVRWDASHAERYSRLIKSSELNELDANQRDFAHMVTRTKLPHSIERPMDLDLQVFALQELPNLKPDELEDKWDGEVYESDFWFRRKFPIELDAEESSFMEDIIDC